MSDLDKACICMIIVWLLMEINNVSPSPRRVVFIFGFIVLAGLNLWEAV